MKHAYHSSQFLERNSFALPKYSKNLRIARWKFLGNADCLVFQAGTGFQGDTIVTKGGRVLTVTSKGADLQDAVQKAQKALSHIQFEGMYFRKDIGYEFA